MKKINVEKLKSYLDNENINPNNTNSMKDLIIESVKCYLNSELMTYEANYLFLQDLGLLEDQKQL